MYAFICEPHFNCVFGSSVGEEKMMQLNVSEWKEFRVGDLFNIVRGKTLSSDDKKEYAGGDYSCINGGSVNNGEMCKMSSALQQQGFLLQDVPSLSLSRVGNAGLTCVQTLPYYIADNAFSLNLKFQHNEFVYMFLSTCLNQELFKYSYGRTVSSNKYLETVIKLPIQHNPDGTPYIVPNHTYSKDGYVPDWQFMEDYMKSLHHKPLTTKNTVRNGLALKVDEWKEFHIIDLFEIKRGNINSLNEVENGDVPIVSASGDNEGISFYGNVLAPYCNNITVSMNGVNTGFTAYHGYEFNINSDCCVLLQKFDMNQCIGIFIATVIGMLRYKYSYGRKMTVERISVENIRLPIQHNPDGTPYIDPNCTYSEDGYVPDWQFMEDYMKALPYGDRL